MSKNVVVITGAAGFLGSAITVALAPECRILAIDQRQPGAALCAAAPGVQWEQLNIADSGRVTETFEFAKAFFGRVDYVVHFAAYSHFGMDWREQYEQTNIKGSENIVEAAIKTGARRLLFASSIAAVAPPVAGQVLNEASPTGDYLPYAKSKSMAEKIIASRADRLPAIALRIAGVFSDWCELPPLFSLIRLWSAIGPYGRIMTGKGESGLPFIHRRDLVEIVKRCLARHDQLERHEVLLASPPGAVLHKEIYAVVKQAITSSAPPQPIAVSPRWAKTALALKTAANRLIGKPTYEQPWMLEFIDRPWVVDTRLTQKKLDWHCTPGYGVLERLPVILQNYTSRRSTWLARNSRRNNGEYLYSD